MTVRELIDLLAEYPDDTPVFHWHGPRPARAARHRHAV